MEWTREALIGRGSTATVSLATDTCSGELFAVKSTELSRSKFLQKEQEILSKLNSPYLVKYKGFDITREENNHLYYNLFMEYLPHGTLYEEIRRHGGRLEEAMIKKYAWEILQGLEYLHASGVVHCDIKSTNILIGEKNAKISDLGCAKFSEKVSRNSDSHKVVFSGTPMFMSPEAVLGQEQGFESDIWALGCTVIEMAAGTKPWPQVHDPISALYRIGFSGDIPEFPSWLSQKGKDFLGICLRRDPKERLTAKELLKHPFFEDLVFELDQVIEFVASSYSYASPKSVFDHSVWDSFGSSSDHEVSSLNSSASSRIENLIGFECDWIWDEDWFTVRSHDKEDHENLSDDSDEDVNVILADEISVVYLLDMSFLGVYEVELASSMSVNTDVSVDRKRGFVIAFESVENDVVCRGLKKLSSLKFNFSLSLCFILCLFLREFRDIVYIKKKKKKRRIKQLRSFIFLSFLRKSYIFLKNITNKK